MDQQLQGVTYDNIRRSFKARIFYSGQERFIGRYNSSKEAALAYDQAARFVNSLLSEGSKRAKTQGGRQKRARPLNFPDLCPTDPKVACRLQVIFKEAAVQPAAGTTAAVACQSDQAGGEQDDPSDALSQGSTADEPSAGPLAQGLSSVAHTAADTAAHQAAAGAVTAAACPALRTATSGGAALAAALAPSYSVTAGKAGALSAFAEAATTPACAAAPAAPAPLAGAASTAGAIGIAAVVNPAPGAFLSARRTGSRANSPGDSRAGSPAGSWAGSCQLPEAAAAQAVHDGDSGHVGSADDVGPEVDQQVQQEQQQLYRGPSPARQTSAGAGGTTEAPAASEGAHLDGRAVLMPQQQQQLGALEIPRLPVGSGNLTTLPLLEDAEWQQLLQLLAGRADGVNPTDGPVPDIAAGGAGSTPPFHGMDLQQDHVTGTRMRVGQQQQQQQCLQQRHHSTCHLAPLCGASHFGSAQTGARQQGLYMQQGSGNCNGSSHFEPPSSLGLPAAAAAAAGAAQTSAGGVTGAFGSVPTPDTVLGSTAEPLAPLLARSGTAAGTVFGIADGFVEHPGAAALWPEPEALVEEQPVQSVSPLTSGANAGPAAAAATAGGGLWSCVSAPPQALLVIDRVLQGLKDLIQHMQQPQPHQQYQHTVIIISSSSSPLGPITDWLHAAWYLEAAASVTLSGALPPAAVVTAVSAVKAASPAVDKPNRLALLLLEQVAVVCSDTLAAAEAQGEAGMRGVAARSYVLQVLQELQKGMAAMQRFLAKIPADAEICCAQLLEAYVTSKYLPSSPKCSPAVTETLWRLAQLL